MVTSDAEIVEERFFDYGIAIEDDNTAKDDLIT